VPRYPGATDAISATDVRQSLTGIAACQSLLALLAMSALAAYPYGRRGLRLVANLPGLAPPHVVAMAPVAAAPPVTADPKNIEQSKAHTRQHQRPMTTKRLLYF
jgi:hypothetical protein